MAREQQRRPRTCTHLPNLGEDTHPCEHCEHRLAHAQPRAAEATVNEGPVVVLEAAQLALREEDVGGDVAWVRH